MRGAPDFCPTKAFKHLVDEALRIYKSNEELANFYRAATKIEKEGYCIWPRVREVVELCKKLGIKKVGIAFCIGLSEEARILDEILTEWGFEVYSVCCKCGSIDKTQVGLSEEDKLKPGSHEAMCNPVLQALILNEVGTELNIMVGLCVGHDSIFMRYSKAPIVCLVVKDRVTGHNPAAALYVKTFFRDRVRPPKG